MHVHVNWSELYAVGVSIILESEFALPVALSFTYPSVLEQHGLSYTMTIQLG